MASKGVKTSVGNGMARLGVKGNDPYKLRSPQSPLTLNLKPFSQGYGTMAPILKQVARPK